MIAIKEKEQCCGCEACRQICPKNCIEMKSDKEGFLYPEIDNSKCIACGLCDMVCPENQQEGDLVSGYKISAYGGWHVDDKLRKESSSGGAFSLFANYILDRGGIVFGCALDEEMHARHVGVESVDELGELRGSKYVQSKIGDSYKKVKAAIENGQMVLFVGTPCQAAGLYTYMGNKKHSNLWIMDFICHGVPSPQIFEEYLKEEENRNKSKIVIHKFRNKDKGWSQTGLQLGTYSEFSNGAKIRRYPALRDSYMNGFLGDLYLRPSCYRCSFKQISQQYADITIADFWGVNKIDKELNDKKGTSLMLIQSDHGDFLWSKVNKQFFFREVNWKEAIKYNKPILKSANKSMQRDYFFEKYYDKGYKYVSKRYMSAFAWLWNKIKVEIIEKVD